MGTMNCKMPTVWMPLELLQTGVFNNKERTPEPEIKDFGFEKEHEIHLRTLTRWWFQFFLKFYPYLGR